MCGRYMFSAEQSSEILQIAQEVESKYGKDAWTPGEIKPSMAAPVLISDHGAVHPELLTWGFKLEKSLVINARAETAAEKPMFRDSLVKRRCVVPSSGFFEWDRQKHKFFFTLPSESALYMAGLYSVRDGKACYCILTTAANESMAEVHHRMPLVLTKDQLGPWLEQPESAFSFLSMVPPMLTRVSAKIKCGCGKNKPNDEGRML